VPVSTHPDATAPAPDLFAPAIKFDHTSPWWFRLANILLGRRRLRAQRKVCNSTFNFVLRNYSVF
jgi:hypothetical protein